MRLDRLAWIGLLMLAPPAPAQDRGADPFVSVSDIGEDGMRADPASTAWYLLRMTIRPTGTQVLGVPVAAINDFRARAAAAAGARAAAPWCRVNLLSERSYASASPAIQAAIEESFRLNPDHRFVLRGRFTGGAELEAVIGHFAECSGRIGSFILLADTAARPPAIVHVDALPFESGLQYMRSIDGRITVSTCFECGDATGLFYDRRRRRFRWEPLGD